jgi:hypothetical protein
MAHDEYGEMIDYFDRGPLPVIGPQAHAFGRV